MKKLTLVLVAILFAITGILAQTPNQFKYQAALRDVNGGVMASKSVIVDISILQGSVTGTSVFTEQHSRTTTEQGLINLNIGSASSLSVIDWSAAIYFIKISIDGTEIGTSQLLSVPYALQAKTAETAETADYNNLTNLPTIPDVLSDLTDINTTGVATGNVLSFNGTAWTPASMTILDNGNVGIGTNTPTARFEIVTAPGIEAIDASQTTGGNSAGGLTQWQSFTAENDGLLTKIELRVWTPTLGADATGTINIYEGEGVEGNLLSSQNVTYEDIPGIYQSYTFDSPATITAGAQYTYEFTTPVHNIGWVYLNTDNPYSGGRASNVTDWDFMFKTYITPDVISGTSFIVDDNNVGIGTQTPTSKLQVVGLPEYADNAAALAGGLTIGAFYRTGDLLKVVH